MPKIHASPLPTQALLSRYTKDGSYTDCYSTDVPITVSHEQFVVAFYTTWLFKIERLILKLAVSRPSTDEQAVAVAAGDTDQFAAWSVEDRASNQLLMCDMHGKTRSWFMTEGIEIGGVLGTRVYFGSAVVPARNKGDKSKGIGTLFRLLLGFHKLYSIALLSSAASKLRD